MVIEILPAYSIRSVRICVVAPTQDAGLRDIFREQVSEPVDAIVRRPCFLSVTIEAVQCDNTNNDVS